MSRVFKKLLVRKIEFHEGMAKVEAYSPKLREFHRRNAIKAREELLLLTNFASSAASNRKAKDFKMLDKLLDDRRRGLLHLSNNACSYCHGAGTIWTRSGNLKTCSCVHRTVFDVAMRKYHYISDVEIGRVFIIQRASGPFAEMTGRDYLGDVVITANRILGKKERVLFQLHSIERHPWRVCLSLFPRVWYHYFGKKADLLDKGLFFHSVYRYKNAIGKELLALGIYPFSEYFTGVRIKLKDDNLTDRFLSDPWLNGGSWQDFRDDPQWMEQYKSYCRLNRINNLQPGEHPWRKRKH